jgi:quinol monooxygenase YgiN
MAEIAMIVRLPVAEGKAGDVLAVAEKLVAATEDEPGTTQYVVHTDDADPSSIWFYELYADKDALDAHVSTTAMAEAMAAFAGLLDGAPEMHFLSIAARRGG